MKKIFLIVLVCIVSAGCSPSKQKPHVASKEEDAKIQNILNQPVSDEKELELSRHIKDCTPFVQVTTGETNQYGTMATKKLILGFEGNFCVYKMFVNGKQDEECRFPKDILPKLADTSTKRVYLKNWTEAGMKYCKYSGHPDKIK